jgi:hypothetical protein
LLQKLNRLGLVTYSPLDDPKFVAAAGGEGVEASPRDVGPTGLTPQKNFSPEKGVNLKKRPENSGFGQAGTETLLGLLKSLEIYVIELKPLDRFERAVLSKARILVEAELNHRRKTKNRWQVSLNRRRARWREAKRRERRRAEKEKLMTKQKERETTEGAGPEPEAIGGYPPPKPEELGPAPSPRPPGPVPKEPEERAEVELEIMRVGPNPRILQCKYKLLADEIKIHLWVKTNRNFVRGMKLKMAEQEGGDWKWEGILPRFRGRW